MILHLRSPGSTSSNERAARATTGAVPPLDNAWLAFAGDYPDPSVLRDGSDYYCVHSSFEYSPGLLVWHSTDLTTWRPLAHALPQYDGDVWAPELVRHERTFYIYYKTTGGNHVVTAPHPAGPWSAPSDAGVGWIDPGHVVGPDGTCYLHLSDGHAVELQPDGLRVRGAASKVYAGWTIPADWRVEGFCLEGPKLFWRDGWCYLVSAQGGTAGPATSHMAIVARSRHPLGPWTDSPHNPLLHTADRSERWWSKGHATLFDTPDGRWFASYHAYERGYHTLGRQTLFAPVAWTADGWPRVVGSPEGLGIDRSSGMRMPLSDDFTTPTLGLQWQFFGEQRDDKYATGDGVLQLTGPTAVPADASPLAINPRDRAYAVEVEVELTGSGGEAGMLLWYNRHAFAGIALADQGVRYVRAAEGGFLLKPTDARRVRLRVVNDSHEIDFFAGDGDGWQRLPFSIEVSGFHHNTFGGFLSLRPALYAAGNAAARFRRFRYTPLNAGSLNDT